MKTVILLFVCLVLTAIPVLVVHADENMAAKIPVDEEQVNEGRQVFQKRCSSCHKLPEKTKRTASQWELLLDVMQGIMQQRGVTVISEVEKQQVLTYLKDTAIQLSPEHETEAGDLFVTRCALCHQLPEPGMLKPQQWKLIIGTMQLRMQQVGVPQLKEQETEMILEYLSKRAR